MSKWGVEKEPHQSAVSTPNGDGDLIQAKWLSVDNHVHNKHKKTWKTLSSL